MILPRPKISCEPPSEPRFLRRFGSLTEVKNGESTAHDASVVPVVTYGSGALSLR
ncbi:Uncharacterised protein [Klebsiella pneumoniae]|nr:Uncharacterised protein [Klebsiella pneumoniae]